MSEISDKYQEVRQLCDHCMSTGVFKRRYKRSWTGSLYRSESVPKSVTAYGYLQMNIFGRPHLVHRLIWLWMTGVEPEYDIDHINGDRLDNRWCNLRAVTRTTNLRNQGIRSDNSSGANGVSFAKDRGKWHAYIGIGDGKRKTLGHFDSIDDAIDARLAAERDLGCTADHGRRNPWRG